MLKHQVYALPCSDENIKTALKERFYRITPEYILIFSKNKVKEGYVISGNDFLSFTLQDSTWLIEAVAQLAFEYAQENEQFFLNAKDNFLQEFLTELKREQANKGELN